MPKVTEEYVKQKKTKILDATLTVFKNKPLYEITMLDVIQKAGLSKGGIYRYYKDIDDVLVEMVNRESEKQNYREDIDMILKMSYSKIDTITSLLLFLGRYLEESATTIGKIQMELTLLVATHSDRAQKITNRLIEQKNGQYLMQSLFQIIGEGLATGAFISTKSMDEIVSFVQIYIEGLVKQKVLEKCYGLGKYVDTVKMMGLLADALHDMLGVSK